MTAMQTTWLPMCLALAGASLTGASLTGQQTSGRVLDVLGDPVPAALVEVVVEGAVLRKTYADGEGVYMLPKLPPFGASLRISKRGKAARVLPKQGPRTRTVRNVTLLDAGKVHGRITDEHGTPVHGVAVVAVHGKDSVRARTDRDGRYTLDGVPLGPVSINVWTGECAAQKPVRLRMDSTCDFRLTRGKATPRKVTVQGLPAALKGACIEVLTANMALMPSAGRVPLADDGSATIMVNELTVISPKVPGFVTDPLGRIAIEGSSDLQFTAKQQEPGAGMRWIKGKVRTGGNKRIQNQMLVFCDQSGTFLATTDVDRSGNFRVRLPRSDYARIRVGMPLDRWQLVDDEAKVRDGYVWVPIFPGHEDIELRVEATGSIDTAVRAADGTLLALADITIAEPGQGFHALITTASDRAGRLQLALPADDYCLLAVSPDGVVCKGKAYVRANRTVDVEWRTVESGSVNGVVLDRAGKPLAGIELFLAAREITDENQVHAAERQTARVLTDRLGRFRCRGLPPGDWTVVAPGNSQFDTTEFAVRRGRDHTLKLEPR